MRSPNAKALTAAERAHVALVKSLPCSVCDEPGPSDAHHIKQGLHYATIPLCRDCHMGSHNGIHGRRAIWNVTKKTELDCLADTMRRLLYGVV